MDNCNIFLLLYLIFIGLLLIYILLAVVGLAIVVVFLVFGCTLVYVTRSLRKGIIIAIIIV